MAVVLVTGEKYRHLLDGDNVERAIYEVKPGHDYPRAWREDGVSHPVTRGARRSKTYRQLADGPKSGAALFAELEQEQWLLPKSNRPYRRSEFHHHLRWAVTIEALHIRVESGGNSWVLGPAP